MNITVFTRKVLDFGKILQLTAALLILNVVKLHILTLSEETIRDGGLSVVVTSFTNSKIIGPFEFSNSLNPADYSLPTTSPFTQNCATEN